ncbi:Protein of unknown function DUF4728 [Cinara cedri]|uniref:Uncharacterized protein n=1 Tax=Cinara cedri TaxID=506608 RepID=A0A5E4MK36_9HEMI|nr:Protein of unknown function DUF4728 [Cinara cedri]
MLHTLRDSGAAARTPSTTLRGVAVVGPRAVMRGNAGVRRRCRILPGTQSRVYRPEGCGVLPPPSLQHNRSTARRRDIGLRLAAAVAAATERPDRTTVSTHRETRTHAHTYIHTYGESIRSGSLRTGCYASVIYAMVYFALNTTILGTFLHFERPYFTGNGTAPQSKSFLEDKISETTVIFHMVVLVCAGFGILTCIVLLVGIYFDLRVLFVPWIFVMFLATIVDVAHSIYLCIVDSVEFNPSTAILYTVDFFLIILNVYAVLCVISQYQELMAGRGTARFEQTLRISPVRYTCQPTGTSCLSSKRPATLPASPTQSPTKAIVTTSTGTGSSAFTGSRRGSRKHVQFPDFDTPGLKSADLLHANWKQGSSPPPDQSNVPDTSSQAQLDNEQSRSNTKLLISTQDYPKTFITDL